MTTPAALLALYLISGGLQLFRGPLRAQYITAIERFRGTALLHALTGRKPPARWQVIGFSAIVALGIVALWPVFLIEHLWNERHTNPKKSLASALQAELEKQILFHTADALISYLDREWGSIDGVLFSPYRLDNFIPASEWSIEAEARFRKDIRIIDRSLRERVRQAIKSICDEPVLPHGDTKRPLEGNLDGLWRYRVGNFRLIYRPNTQAKRITMIAFAPRGSAYASLET